MRYRIGELVELVTEKNLNLKYGLKDIVGVTLEKQMIPTIANLSQTDLSEFIIVHPKDFVYNPRTHGKKIGLGFNTSDKCFISTWNNNTFRVSPRMKNTIMPEYLYLHFLRERWDREACFYAWGSSTVVLLWSSFCDMYIDIPPISEQRKIVHDYQVITDRIELLKKENESIIQVSNNLYTKCFNDNDYPMTPLSQLCSKIGSGATPRGGKSVYCNKGVSLIRSTNVYDYQFSYNDLAHINDDQANALSNVIVEPYDVLFNITGVSIARCCMVPQNVLPARVNQHVMIIRSNAGKYMNYFLLMTLCKQSNKNQLLGIGQSGSTREAINKQEMESFKIALPPSEEIESFGRQVERCFNHIQNITHEIEILQSMQSLLLSRL